GRPIEDEQDGRFLQDIVFVLGPRCYIAEASGAKHLALELYLALKDILCAVSGMAMLLDMMPRRETHHINPWAFPEILPKELVVNSFDLPHFVGNLSDSGILIRPIDLFKIYFVGIYYELHPKVPPSDTSSTRFARFIFMGCRFSGQILRAYCNQKRQIRGP